VKRSTPSQDRACDRRKGAESEPDRATRGCGGRLPLPDIATMAEFVPDYEASVWAGIGTPKATPAEIVEKLNREINSGLADPKMKARLADLGGTVLPGTPADFGRLIDNISPLTGLRDAHRANLALHRARNGF